MRSLKRNQKTLYYALYEDEVPILDDNGDDTLETKTGYSRPVKFNANVSAGKGEAEENIFGKDVDFTRAIFTTNTTLPIDEYSRIWLETKPVVNPDGSADGNSADYEVAAPVAESLNSLVIAIKRRKKNKKNAGG